MKFEIESKFNVGDEVYAFVEGYACKAKIAKIIVTKCINYISSSGPLQYTIHGSFPSRSGKGVFLEYYLDEENIFSTEAEALVKEREYHHKKNEYKITHAYASAKDVMKYVSAKSCNTVRQKEERKLISRFVRDMDSIRKLNDTIEVKK